MSVAPPKAIMLFAAIIFFLPVVNGQPLSSEKQSYRLEAGKADSMVISLLDSAYKVSMADPDSAIILYRQAEESSVRMNWGIGIISAMGGAANCYRTKGDYDKSITVLRQAIVRVQQLYHDAVADELLSYLYIEEALTYEQEGLYTMSVLCFFKALDVLKKSWLSRPALFHMARVYNNLSILWHHLGEKQQAWNDLKTATQIIRIIGDSTLSPEILLNTGLVHAQGDNITEALYYFHKLLELATQRDLINMQQAALINMGRMYIRQGKNMQAMACFRDAAKRNEKVKINVPMLVYADYHMGYGYYHVKDYRRAISYLEKAISKAEATGFKAVLSDMYQVLADAYAAVHRYDEAYSHLQTSTLLGNKLQTEEKNKIGALLLSYHTAEKDREIARKQLQLTRKESQLREKNIWLGAISGGILLLAALLVSLYRNNKHRQHVIHLKAIMQGEETERNRIARDLHDGIGGMLAGLTMQLNAVQKEHPGTYRLIRLNDMKRMIQEATAEIRKTAHNLMPGILMRHSFPDALQVYCTQISKNTQIHIDLQCYGDLEQTEPSLALILYRIIQELIQNILKHAQASHAVIQIRKQEKHFSITVEDNGTGFDMEEQAEGIGLHNLKLRVKMLRGKFTIESAKHTGTIACITFEYP